MRILLCRVSFYKLSQENTVLAWTCQSLSKTVTPSSTARNLGAILDNRLSWIPNILAVSDPEIRAGHPVRALVISHLDNCNSLLAGFPISVTKPLQHPESRMLHRDSFFIYLNSPMWPPSFVTSTGFQLRPASDSRWWYWPSRLSTETAPVYL